MTIFTEHMLHVSHMLCVQPKTVQPINAAKDTAYVCLQVLDRLLGYVTNVNYTAGASHM